MPEQADPVAAIIAFPQKPEDRLRVALRDLEAALDEQAMAFQEFRMNLAVLGGAVGGLERSLESYRGTLDALADDSADAHAMAMLALRRAETL